MVGFGDSIKADEIIVSVTMTDVGSVAFITVTPDKSLSTTVDLNCDAAVVLVRNTAVPGRDTDLVDPVTTLMAVDCNITSVLIRADCGRDAGFEIIPAMLFVAEVGHEIWIKTDDAIGATAESVIVSVIIECEMSKDVVIISASLVCVLGISGMLAFKSMIESIVASVLIAGDVSKTTLVGWISRFEVFVKPVMEIVVSVSMISLVVVFSIGVESMILTISVGGTLRIEPDWQTIAQPICIISHTTTIDIPWYLHILCSTLDTGKVSMVVGATIFKLRSSTSASVALEQSTTVELAVNWVTSNSVGVSLGCTSTAETTPQLDWDTLGDKFRYI